MTKLNFKSILPMVLGATLFIGSVFVYVPEDAQAGSFTAADQSKLEQLVNNPEG